MARGMGAEGILDDSTDSFMDALNESHKRSKTVVIEVSLDPEARHADATDMAPLFL
jgi:thiamine pyrophosphate-dependent acetolactate synthase large subunit-like protein